ncbi:MAG: HAD-IA family hydrolase [Firmicutes bacterium]|nr:HAD-IA family hydrolase [Bacillota bacterium]
MPVGAGVVSDTWASLNRVFKNCGLRKYFSTFIMPSVLGVVKPSQLMFNRALSELSVKPEEALFIDNNIKNVRGALKLGINSVLIIRERNSRGNSDIISINSLKELYEIL